MSTLLPQDLRDEMDAQAAGTLTNERTNRASDAAGSIGTVTGRVVAAIVAVIVGAPKPGAGADCPLRLATVFRLVGPSNRPLRCATYRVATGIELRLEYEDREDILKTRLFKPGQEALIAEMTTSWRDALDARGFTALVILN